MGKVQFPFPWGFVLVLTKLSFLKGDWALDYNSITSRDFPGIS